MYAMKQWIKGDGDQIIACLDAFDSGSDPDAHGIRYRQEWEPLPV